MKLAYGVRGVEIPEDCAAAFGYRAILHRGAIDIVHDRVARHIAEEGAWKALQCWYEIYGMIWLDELAQHLKGNDPSIYDWDDGPFHVRASAQSSYGYLYVSVWVGPE